MDDEDEWDAELPSKTAIFSFTKDLLQQADRAVARDLGGSSSGTLGYNTARLAGDALLVAYLGGNYIPPLRLAVIRTLMVPGNQVCLSGRCERTGCRGNNIKMIKPQGVGGWVAGGRVE
jgi:hypothetical protein